VSEYVLATPESNSLDRLNGLACRWFDRRTAQPTVSVFFDELEDVDHPWRVCATTSTGMVTSDQHPSQKCLVQAPASTCFCGIMSTL
jgi:hypothetical protein